MLTNFMIYNGTQVTTYCIMTVLTGAKQLGMNLAKVNEQVSRIGPRDFHTSTAVPTRRLIPMDQSTNV